MTATCGDFNTAAESCTMEYNIFSARRIKSAMDSPLIPGHGVDTSSLQSLHSALIIAIVSLFAMCSPSKDPYSISFNCSNTSTGRPFDSRGRAVEIARSSGDDASFPRLKDLSALESSMACKTPRSVSCEFTPLPWIRFLTFA